MADESASSLVFSPADPWRTWRRHLLAAAGLDPAATETALHGLTRLPRAALLERARSLDHEAAPARVRAIRSLEWLPGRMEGRPGDAAG